MKARVGKSNAGYQKILAGKNVARLTKQQALELVQAAKADFLRQVKHVGSGVPPDYLDSFEIVRRGNGWIVRNTSDESMYVEFGAYFESPEEGEPRLRFRPLGHAVDILANRGGAR